MNTRAVFLYLLVLVHFAALVTGASVNTATCELESVNRTASRKGCETKTITVKGCRGACFSVTESLISPPWHKTTCTCCRQSSATSLKTVSLKCSGGSTVTVSFKSATACSCQLCWAIKVTKENSVQRYCTWNKTKKLNLNTPMSYFSNQNW